MRKLLSLMVCCTLICGLSGCAGSSNEFRSDEELADEMIENIIDCAEKEDAQALTGLFSQYTKESTFNLTEQAEDFLDFFQGECEDWKGNASSHQKSEYGKIVWRELRGQYSVTTDHAQYKIAYVYIPFDREEPEKEGLTAVEITTEETFNEEDFLWSLDQKPGIYVSEGKEETFLERRLLSPEEMIQKAGLTEEQVRGIDLEEFIQDFDITEKDVDTLNIPLLLEEYEPEYKGRSLDVSDLLEDDIENRSSDFTENVIAIAFMENKNTSTECVYYDLLGEKRYQASDVDLFENLYQTQGGYYTNGQKIVQALDECGVFSWESKTEKENLADPQSMGLGVEYDDGTLFRVKASGLLSQVLPEEYAKVRDLLLSGE